MQTNTSAAVKSHPAFAELVAAEKTRRQMVRRSGGRAALAANSALCFRLEQQIMRDTGATFSVVSAAALSGGR